MSLGALQVPQMSSPMPGLAPEDFQPIALDVSPLQKFLVVLAKQVEALQQDNAALREEINSLRVGKRLEALEQGLQELADTQGPGSAYTNPSQTFAPFPVPGQEGAQTVGTSSAADSNWVMFELNGLKDRISAMERKAEALWHHQENSEELRGAVERLKHDLEAVQGSMSDTQGAARMAQHMAEKLEAVTHVTKETLTELQDKCNRLDSEDKRAAEDRRDTASKLEANINSIWDQIRHVENSLSQRLTLAETSQVSTLQEVDEMKEAANEVVQRVDDNKRHVAALESKLESFNTQVAAAISPLHNSLAVVQVRLEELNAKKQDVATAITVEDVNVGVSRAIDHADRRADNIIKSIGAMEERVEELNDLKANKSDVVMTSDLEVLLTAHARELDTHLAKQKEDIMKTVALKADKEELLAQDGRLGARISSLETAILKGLKAISDKVSAALAEKLDLTRFNEFKVQVRAILADVEDRLRDWSPAARGMKAPMDGAGALGASSCLCCDSRVRSVRDLQAMGFSNNDKVFNPERLPATEPLLPSINKSPDVAAYASARVNHRKKDVTALLRSNTNSLMETLPAPGPGSPGGPFSPTQQLLSTVDPGALIGRDAKGRVPSASAGNGSGRMNVDVETISGAITSGRIPSTRGPGRAPSKPQARGQPDGISPWQNPSSNSIDLAIDMTHQRSSGRLDHAPASSSPPAAGDGARIGSEGGAASAAVAGS